MKKRKININPVTFFLLSSILVIIISAFAELFQWGESYVVISNTSKQLETVLVLASSVLNIDSFKEIISELMDYFINFKPLQIALISFISIGVANKSGIIKTYSKKIFNKIPINIFFFLTIFIGILSNLIPEIGYGILLPLVALIYKEREINPIVGLVTFFSGLTIGYNANVFIGIEDYNINSISSMIINITDPNYKINVMGNYYVMIVMTIILSIVGAIITRKLTMKKFKRYEIEKIELNEKEKKIEKTAFNYSIIITLINIILLIYSVLPGLPLSGFLLDNNQNSYIQKLLSEKSFFMQGSIFIFAGILFVKSLIFGIINKKIKDEKDFNEALTSESKSMTNVIALSLAATLFFLILNKTKLLIIINAMMINFFNSLNLAGITLIVMAFLLIAISNIFIPSTTLKWVMLSPVVIPMMTALNISPEYIELLYKAGNSVTNALTPMFPFLIILIALIYNYARDMKENITIKNIIKLLMPYTIIFTLIWILIIISWYIVGLPIGIDTFPII